MVFNASGILNLDAWTFQTEVLRSAFINPQEPTVIVGPVNNPIADFYTNATNFVFPSDFGPGVLPGGTSFATSGSGDTFGPIRSGLIVPQGYNSGDLLSGSATYAGETFESLGMDVGTYVWTWGDGGTADSFTLNVIPEPGSALLLGMGLAGLSVVRRSRRRATDRKTG